MVAWRGLCCHCNDGTETQEFSWPPGVYAAWNSQPGSISTQVSFPRTLERDPGGDCVYTVTFSAKLHPSLKFKAHGSPGAHLPVSLPQRPWCLTDACPRCGVCLKSWNEAVWSLLQTTHHSGSAAVDPFCPAQSKPTSLVWKLRFRSLHGQVLGKVPVQEGTLVVSGDISGYHKVLWTSFSMPSPRLWGYYSVLQLCRT